MAFAQYHVTAIHKHVETTIGFANQECVRSIATMLQQTAIGHRLLY